MIGLTLGPLLYHWPSARRRDFYARIADEAPVDCVHLGEVVCSRRAPFSDPDLPDIAERLRAAGKQVVLSSLALVTSDREVEAVREQCDAGFVMEANDVSCLRALAGRPHVIGPLINLFNEGALAYLARQGAIRVVPPPELSADGIGVLARCAGDMEIEVMAFGRHPLSVSARCYHARAHGLHKDGCQFVCGDDPDGLPVQTLDGQPIVMINGNQTMSHGYVVLLRELPALIASGVGRFRLSPQDVDMVAVTQVFRDTLDDRLDVNDAMHRITRLTNGVPLVNGYMHRREGLAWVDGRCAAPKRGSVPS